MIARLPDVSEVVGTEFSRRLADRARSLLHSAVSSKRISVHCDEPLDIAAAWMLWARGYVSQVLESDQSPEVCGVFEPTPEGRQAALRRPIRHS